MPERTHGGVFTDSLLTGSLQHYLLSGVDFSGAADSAGRPISGSAAEAVFNEISLKATIVIMRPEATGASFALETNRADWSAGELQVAIRLLGTIGVDVVDVSAVTVSLVPYSFREENIVSFLDLTDTPGTYAGHGDKQLSVVATENGIEFKPVEVTEAPIDGQTYARRNSTWILVSPQLIDSVFGRTGQITAQPGDYDASLVDNDSTVAGASVANALNTLQGEVDTINTSLDGVVVDINDLSDVNVVGITVGDILKWDGAVFVPTPDTSVGSIGELSDVLLTSLDVGDVLAWNGVAFLPIAQSGLGDGVVNSIYGRSGTVIADLNDYSASLVDNDSAVSGATVKDALDSLDTTKASIDGSDLLFPSLPGSTFTTLSDLTGLVHSAGLISGGDITDNADGTVAVAAGIGMIRATNSSIGSLFLMDFPADVVVPLVDDDINFIFIDYNAGTPVVSVSTTEPLDQHSRFNVGRVYRDGINIIINGLDNTVINDSTRLMANRFIGVDAYARISGGLISKSGTRNISITPGEWFHGLTKYTTPSFNSVGPDTFSYMHRDGVGGWTTIQGQSQIDNTRFDDGSGVLGTLADGAYGIHWAFLGVDGHVTVLYGQDDYTFLEAGNVIKLPNVNLPDSVIVSSRIIGKIIIRKNDAAFSEIFSEFHTFLDRAVDKLRNMVEDTAPQLGGNLDTNGNVIDMSVIADPSYLEGRLFYDTLHHGLAFFSEIPDVKLQIGQETVLHVVNNTGVTIVQGIAVKISGTTGVEPTIAPVVATINTAQVLGLVAADILDGATGIVMVYGTMEGVDTNGLTPGSIVYLSDIIPGEFDAIAPTAPIDVIRLGTVITSAINGRLLVDARTPIAIKAIADANDVDLLGVSTGDFLKWDGTQFLPTVDVATAAQGALADSATQPGDDISTLTNDLNFLTASTINPYGSQYHYQESEALSNMTGMTYQTKMTMVTSNLPAGDYKISWQGLQDSSSNTVGTGFRVQVDSGAFLLTETLYQKTDADVFLPFAGFNVVTLSAGVRTITLDWIAGSSGTSSNIKEVRLELIRTV